MAAPAPAPAPAVDEDVAEEPAEPSAETVDTVPAWGAAAFTSSSDEEVADYEPPAAQAQTREAVEEPVASSAVIRESIVGVAAPVPSDADAQAEYVPDPLTDTFERRGRHGLDNGPFDQDPPERATTDTGIIDLSGIRGGRTLPSRRALREARNKGEEIVVIDGQEFNTGLIPITRARTTDEVTPAQAPTSAPDDDASATGGWTSIMSGWLNDRQGGKQ